MEVTRDVILDLLPLYLADEVSADTRALVEKHLEADAELARIAEESAAELEEVPIPLTQEDAMKAYEQANKWMVIRTLGLSAIIALVVMCTLLPVMAFVMLYFGQ
jgi:anti-sigma factor RsiW